MTATERTPLQQLVSARAEELGLSLRALARRSQGLIAHTTLTRLAGAERWSAVPTAKTLSGLALALELPETQIREAAEATHQGERFRTANSQFMALPPEKQQEVLDLMQRLYAEQVEARETRKRTRRPIG